MPAPVKSAAAFRTISEVAKELDLQPHVLRFWETKFPQVKPMKRGGGRRYYRPEDVEVLREIQRLLHQEGFTIKGVQARLRKKGSAAKLVDSARARSALTVVQTRRLKKALTELKSIRAELVDMDNVD
ncbi:MAG: hypothetical protein Alpg2KO_30940 [Alphaproteobacteria bacterium]